MPSKDTNEDAFTEWTDKIHRALALKPILWEICCDRDAYTMFKIEYPNQGDGVRDFKWKRWHDTNAKRDADATPAPQKKKDSEKKEKEKKEKSKTKKTSKE